MLTFTPTTMDTCIFAPTSGKLPLQDPAVAQSSFTLSYAERSSDRLPH